MLLGVVFGDFVGVAGGGGGAIKSSVYIVPTQFASAAETFIHFPTETEGLLTLVVIFLAIAPFLLGSTMSMLSGLISLLVAYW